MELSIFGKLALAFILTMVVLAIMSITRRD